MQSLISKKEEEINLLCSRILTSMLLSLPELSFAFSVGTLGLLCFSLWWMMEWSLGTRDGGGAWAFLSSIGSSYPSMLLCGPSDLLTENHTYCLKLLFIGNSSFEIIDVWDNPLLLKFLIIYLFSSWKWAKAGSTDRMPINSTVSFTANPSISS